VVTTLIIGLIACIELKEGRFIEVVYFWGALLVVVSVLHALLYYSYGETPTRPGRQWLRWLGIGAFAAGAVWGFAAPCSSPRTPTSARCSRLLLAGVLSGGIPMYAGPGDVRGLRRRHHGPFVYVLATFGNRLFAEIALLIRSSTA